MPHVQKTRTQPRALTGSEIGETVQLFVATGASVRRIFGNDQTIGAERLAGVAPEDVALDEHLVVGAGVDGLVVEVDVEVVVDVLVAKTAGGAASAHVLPVVVMVGDMEVAKVDIAQGSVVADERRLPVVVEVVPRDRDEIRPPNDINLAILARGLASENKTEETGGLMGLFWGCWGVAEGGREVRQG
jgi:hypothetical protein